ncbi:hypothetical protein NA57DRAFT_55904 [Rhizodiscina lignyota]|uniref:F-box domain-containing protein n=1 Tax=Rhizodiscina lignyota TaxID=1504668 RepID=A0A9P4MA30_9PEZI|nr:hypothetical protein NA57DRAFT_55904 [Rhizodiscina lignyota]
MRLKEASSTIALRASGHAHGLERALFINDFMATGFGDLPIELIRKIASYTASYDSLQCLSRVNHYFRDACIDWTVVKEWFKNRRDATFQFAVESDATDFSTWKRYALAESKADKALCGSQDFPSWAPQILALHHPLAAKLPSFYAILKGMGRPPASEGRAYAFCFAASAISYPMPLNGDLNHFTKRLNSNRKLSIELIYAAVLGRAHPLDPNTTHLDEMHPIMAYSGILNQPWAEDDRERDVTHAAVLKALGLMVVQLRAKDFLGKRSLSLPTSSFDFPFHAFMKLPTPFSGDCVARFNTCHLETMTSKEFLEDGEWTGVYIATEELLESPFRPLQQFTFSDCSEYPVPGYVKLQSSEVYGRREIQAMVRIDRGTAVIQLTAGPDRIEYVWYGALTPFGFVGSTAHHPVSWVWIWKVAWGSYYDPSEEVQEQETPSRNDMSEAGADAQDEIVEMSQSLRESELD